MPFVKGQVANPKGRPKGSKDKMPAEIKGMVRRALEHQGGWRYLSRQAEENPVAFMGLVAKLIPAEIKADLGNTDGIVFSIGIPQRTADQIRTDANSDEVSSGQLIHQVPDRTVR